MARGLSLHIGLNSVDPGHYAGWTGRLTACEYDARDMEALARSQGFSTTVLVTRAATVRRLVASVRNAAGKLRRGDIFLLTYSGHGGQLPDRNGDERGDAMDETWILYDREVVDDELYALWGEFRAGVRIVVLSDSCHSGTVTRMRLYRSAGGGVRVIPPDVQATVYRRHRRLYDALQRKHPSGRPAAMGASILLLSGCQDNQLSADGDRNGLFTGTLRSVWSDGAFRGSYRTLHRAVVRRMPPSQSPNLFLAGFPDPRFEKERPFSI